ATLAKRVDVTFDSLDIFEGGAFGGKELMANRHEMLANDMEAGLRHQMMDVGDAAGERGLDGNHAQLGVAGGDPRKATVRGGGGHGLGPREDFADREVRIRPRLALEYNSVGLDHLSASSGQVVSRVEGRDSLSARSHPPLEGEGRPASSARRGGVSPTRVAF